MNTFSKWTLGTLVATGLAINAQALLITPTDSDFSGYNNSTHSKEKAESKGGATHSKKEGKKERGKPKKDRSEPTIDNGGTALPVPDAGNTLSMFGIAAGTMVFARRWFCSSAGRVVSSARIPS